MFFQRYVAYPADHIQRTWAIPVAIPSREDSREVKPSEAMMREEKLP
jgi:hypothetical protein